MSNDYSKTPLSKKLGLKPGYRVYLENAPSNYFKLVNGALDECQIVERMETASCDFIHAFCTEFDHLIQASAWKNNLKKTGMLWISWPKKTSQISTDLNRDIVREFVLSVGLVDVKVAAVDADWSAIKFMYRTKDR